MRSGSPRRCARSCFRPTGMSSGGRRGGGGGGGAGCARGQAAAEAECLRRLRALVPARARLYCTVVTRVNEGKPAREIERVAAEERADLIVMGVHGRSAVGLM